MGEVGGGLRGRVAFVAASSRGLGWASARALAAEGAAVTVTSRHVESAEAAARRLSNEFGVPATGVRFDVTRARTRERALAEAEQRLGPCDILVLNGPGPGLGRALEVSPDQVVEAAATLVAPHVDLAQRSLPHMREQKWGRIVAVGAASMDRANSALVLSGTGRAGLSRYLQALAKDVAVDNVTVNIVQAGMILTERTEMFDQAAATKMGITVAEARKWRTRGIPAGRLGTVEEFAAAVAFFCSPAASYITGQSLLVDGGMWAAT